MLEPLLCDIVLEVTLTGLITDRAIEGVVDEVELEDTGPRRRRLLTLGMHDLTISDGRHTGRCQFWHPLDLDEAHPAHRGCREAGVIAVMRDPDPRLVGGLDDPRTRGDSDLLPIDR